MNSKTISPSIQKASSELISKFDVAWNTRDADALEALFQEGADFQFYHGVMVRGRERIVRFYRDKVFPYLESGLTHITRKYRIREIREGVLIGDGRVDLVIVEEGEEKEIRKRLRVTTVVVQEGDSLKFSAVRIMQPIKD